MIRSNIVNDAVNNSADWPLLVYAILVVILAAVMVGLSHILGQRHKEMQTQTPFESGIKVTGSARLRFSVHFYLVAIFFVIFDLEAVFIVTWAIAFRETGWTGYAGAAVFIAILLAVLVYEWRIGALNFGPDGKRILRAYRKIIKQDKQL